MDLTTVPRPRPRSLGRRRALTTLLGLAIAAPGLGVEKSWNAGDGDWDEPGKWTPFGVPQNDDEIRVGNLPGVQNSTVLLTPPGSSYDLLEITSGMTLDMNNNELVSFDHAWVLGAGSRLVARPAVGGPNPHDFQGVLHVGPGAHFEMRDNVPVRVFSGSESSGTISGRGTFLIAGIVPFENDGVIRPSNNGGLTIQQGTDGDLSIDLDGSTGNGSLSFDTPFSALVVVADALTDGFSGTITMVPGCGLDMEIAQGWVADGQSVIDIVGTNDPNAASQIHGTPFVFGGTMNVNSLQAHLRVLSGVTFAASAEVVVGFTDWLELDGATTVAGGQFVVGNAGVLDFDGPTTMQGGTFDTNSADPANGAVDLNGSTTWSGGCDVTGVMRQFGNAFVSGPSVVDAEVFDMDGDGDTAWTIWHDLVIDADAVQSDGPEDFHGTLTVASSAGRLTVILPAADARFDMAGTMNLIGHPAVYLTRYAGAPLELKGNLNVSGKVATDGFLRALEGHVSIADANAVLRLDGGGLIGSGCAFAGAGELRIGAGGDALFVDASLQGVGLANQGTLRLRSHLRADRFAGEPGSTWEVSLQGTAPGVGYDRLDVAHAATLGGALRVALENDFAPAPGDVFTVLASAALAGAFDNVASGGRIPAVGGSFLVTYGGASDTVVLSQFVPCPADLNGDGVVDFADLLLVLAAWGTPAGDVDGDDHTDFADVLALLAAWGSCA